MRRRLAGRFVTWLRHVDRVLLGASSPVKAVVMFATVTAIVSAALPNVPRSFIDFAGLPLIGGIQKYDVWGPDSLADMYAAKVVLNDPSDMYTKARLEQTPLEAATWSKEASAPYPPAMLLAEAALYRIGEWTGVGFYGVILALACGFLVASAVYFFKTRWYLFPLLYLNFSYFGYRFVYVQDGSYLVLLTVVMAALVAARAGKDVCHLLVAVAIAMKLSPLYHLKNVFSMRPPVAGLFVGIVLAGLVLPYFIWDNYLYIFRYGSELKGDWDNAAAALALVVPFAIVLWYVETRLGFDLEDRVGWGVVPFAMLLAFEMNVARHLLIVLLVPDKRGIRNLAAAAGLAFPVLFPSAIAFNSSLPIATLVLIGGMIHFLSDIGWDRVRDDLRNPGRTLRQMFAPLDRGRSGQA
jgi:hypothetical protein